MPSLQNILAVIAVAVAGALSRTQRIVARQTHGAKPDCERRALELRAEQESLRAQIEALTHRSI